MSPRKYDMTRRRAAVDATRQRILEATMQLHAEQGIVETSWEDIAQRADVAIGTVYRHFPTLDELVPACGELSMRTLALPDAERLRELFGDDAAQDERLRRLVEECHRIYERGGPVIVAVRREAERGGVADAVAAHKVIEEALDALVAAALEPDRPDAAAHGAARAICDYDTWQALRRHGITGARAIDTAQVMLGACLRARPAAR